MMYVVVGDEAHQPRVTDGLTSPPKQGKDGIFIETSCSVCRNRTQPSELLSVQFQCVHLISYQTQAEVTVCHG